MPLPDPLPADRRLRSPPGHSSPDGRQYVLISPCRDEQKYMERTLQSVAAQTEPPTLWIVVDDGSTDRTPEILDAWVRKLPYLRVVTRPDRGIRKLGGGVVEAFNDGFRHVDPDDFDFACKLDLDLDLPPNYFASCMDAMRADPRLANFSGKPYFRMGVRKISEACGSENAVGMVKFYRMKAFREIGGFVPELMWDGIDGHRCRLLGWRAASNDAPELGFEHLRPMGTSHKSWWTGRMRHGRGQWFMGTSLPYMLASALYRMTRPPLVVGGIAMLWGYIKAAAGGMPRLDDPALVAFIRRWQWTSLLRGKAEATRRAERDHEQRVRSPQAGTDR